MIQYFKKNNKIKAFDVSNDKILATIIIGDHKVSNPLVSDFLSLGWEQYTLPPVEQYVPTLEELVEQKIRERYTINQEFEVQRKRDVEQEAFQTYYDYVEQCIAWAKTQNYREVEL